MPSTLCQGVKKTVKQGRHEPSKKGINASSIAVVFMKIKSIPNLYMARVRGRGRGREKERGRESKHEVMKTFTTALKAPWRRQVVARSFPEALLAACARLPSVEPSPPVRDSDVCASDDLSPQYRDPNWPADSFGSELPCSQSGYL